MVEKGETSDFSSRAAPLSFLSMQTKLYRNETYTVSKSLFMCGFMHISSVYIFQIRPANSQECMLQKKIKNPVLKSKKIQGRYLHKVRKVGAQEGNGARGQQVQKGTVLVQFTSIRRNLYLHSPQRLPHLSQLNPAKGVTLHQRLADAGKTLDTHVQHPGQQGPAVGYHSYQHWEDEELGAQVPENMDSATDVVSGSNPVQFRPVWMNTSVESWPYASLLVSDSLEATLL